MQNLLSVPRELVEKHGATAAYLLVKMAYRQRGAKRLIAGKHWFFSPIGRRATGSKAQHKSYRPLADDVPFISSTDALHHQLKSLAKSKAVLVERGLNTMGNRDKTLHFHVPNAERIIKLTEVASKLRWFDVGEAKQYGINTALVLNVIYRDFHLRLYGEEKHLILSRGAISRDTGLPLSTVSGIFKRLQEAKIISSYDGKTFRLLVPNPCELKGNGKGRKNVSQLASVAEALQPHHPAVKPRYVPDNPLLALLVAYDPSAGVKDALQVNVARKKRTGRTRPRGRKYVCEDGKTVRLSPSFESPIDRQQRKQDKMYGEGAYSEERIAARNARTREQKKYLLPVKKAKPVQEEEVPKVRAHFVANPMQVKTSTWTPEMIEAQRALMIEKQKALRAEQMKHWQQRKLGSAPAITGVATAPVPNVPEHWKMTKEEVRAFLEEPATKI